MMVCNFVVLASIYDKLDQIYQKPVECHCHIPAKKERTPAEIFSDPNMIM